ncbi:choline dehydrogenase [Clohesyomyces aquaticus]|uniref:Choline dehydrogenase n=1 Tax=Clohesyomyces aquaticus TaxID=1231657 RepID=A0A1Y1ZIF4_9PLEO|nr:choline dehydrogenase [Clohesyomyces aquaticus]
MSNTYDFIIVGGGTAGCRVAYKLAHAPSRPSVLLVEAGGYPEGDTLRAPFFRYATAFVRPDLDHGHVSGPNKELNDRTINYTRGKGLGGSSIMNFQVYLWGADEDYNRWADLVGDDTWRWPNVKRAFMEIEDFDFEGAKQYSHLANPDPKEHGHSGMVKVSLPPILEKGVAPELEAVIKNGEQINLDFNTGNPIGMGIVANSSGPEGRTTSATAHLVDVPENLTIWTDAAVHKLVIDGTKAVGIETADGRKATSGKDVILCGGAIDTPKILLVNGIGPAEELKSHGVEVVKDLPGVGKHLHDHVLAFVSAEVDGSENDKYTFESNPERLRVAAEEWKTSKSGDFAIHNGTLWGGFLKQPGLEEMPEFKGLDRDLQEYLTKPTVPTYEILSHSVMHPGSVIAEGNSFLTSGAFLMNPQSSGSITLRSSNPEDKPIIDLGFLEHPYDRRILMEAIRNVWTKVYENPDIKKSVVRKISAPESLSDEDILAFMKDAAGTVWHANGSAKMGRKDDPLAVVSPDFRVYGVDGLRVADLSICPLTTNNHTQTTAYVVGQLAAERLIAEYKL